MRFLVPLLTLVAFAPLTIDARCRTQASPPQAPPQVPVEKVDPGPAARKKSLEELVRELSAKVEELQKLVDQLQSKQQKLQEKAEEQQKELYTRGLRLLQLEGAAKEYKHHTHPIANLEAIDSQAVPGSQIGSDRFLVTGAKKMPKLGTPVVYSE